jgi:hypothetical protein
MCHVPAGDSKESAGAPEDEDVETPLMIEVGKGELAGFNREHDLAEIAVERIYLAMAAARPKACRMREIVG